MKKHNFKQFFREFRGAIGFLFWIFLISVSLSTFYTVDVSIWVKIILIAISVIYTVVGIRMINRLFDKEKKQKAERLQELEKRYKYYIDLVNHQIQETLIKFQNELLNAFEIDTNLEYLISFENNRNWICETRNIVKPDSFLIASCLMYSLIDNPIITTKRNEDITELKDTKFNINLDIAINCALRIISEPSTYYEDNLGVWVEEKHPKVDIVVPNTTYQHIISTMYRHGSADSRITIIQFSDLLNLIYRLNCQ